jgi:hypothetical protein
VNRILSWLRTHRPELIAAAVAFFVYCAFSGGMLLHQSGAPHFVYQAEAFLRGQLSLPGQPPNTNDWVLRNGKWFVSFPPFPAVLMMPFVAVAGLAFNDVFFTVCLSALNVGLFVFLLRRLREAGEHSRSDLEILALAAFFAFGSVYFYTSIRGEVWFTAHVVGVTLTLIYLLSAHRARAPFVAGLAFGCAAITRANLMFAFPFFLIECLAPEGRLPSTSALVSSLKTAFPRLLVFGLSALVVLLPAFAMNQARFGKWSEFGHALLYNNRVNGDVQQYGLFNLHYLARNVDAALLLAPTVQWNPFRLGFSGHGMSLFITTPLLLLVPFVKARARLLLALAVTASIIALPGLFYMNDGWYQFGFRFSNDYLPYLFLILALGGRGIGKAFVGLGLAGIVVSTWGALVFGR